MSPSRSRSKGRTGGIGAAVGDFVQLVVDYAKQETLGPLKGLGRFMVFGLAGSLSMSLGLLLLLVGLLRLLQTETGSTFTGDLSWLPYLITIAAAVGVLAFAVVRITKGPAKRTAAADRGTKRS